MRSIRVPLELTVRLVDGAWAVDMLEPSVGWSVRTNWMTTVCRPMARRAN
jgi:hypothetical protein